MQVIRFNDSRSFLQAAAPFLNRAEAENNLILGLAESQAFDRDAYLAAVIDGGECLGCAVRTPPYKAIITRVEARAAECLAADLAERYPDLPEVMGPEPDVTAFAGHWSQRIGVPSVQGMRQRLFEIRQMPRLEASPPGSMRMAAEKDLPLLIEWARAFLAEAMPGDPTDAEKHATARMASRSFFIWEDGKPVSMAAWAGQTAHGVRVNFVYTPPEHRERGYATACVAHLTRKLLDEGRAFCCLYTDLSNPTSNGIYQRIGYRPICDVSNYAMRR